MPKAAVCREITSSFPALGWLRKIQFSFLNFLRKLFGLDIDFDSSPK